MNNVILYGKVSSLKNRLEITTDYTKKQIDEAIKLVDSINTILDRRQARGK